jgi:hypothetical protein
MTAFLLLPIHSRLRGVWAKFCLFGFCSSFWLPYIITTSCRYRVPSIQCSNQEGDPSIARFRCTNPLFCRHDRPASIGRIRSRCWRCRNQMYHTAPSNHAWAGFSRRHGGLRVDGTSECSRGSGTRQVGWSVTNYNRSGDIKHINEM